MSKTSYSQQMQQRILDFVIGYIQEHGYPPTRREIGEAVGLKSPSTVQHYITQMLISGMLETDDPLSSRALRMPGWKFAKEE